MKKISRLPIPNFFQIHKEESSLNTQVVKTADTTSAE